MQKTHGLPYMGRNYNFSLILFSYQRAYRRNVKNACLQIFDTIKILPEIKTDRIIAMLVNVYKRTRA